MKFYFRLLHLSISLITKMAIKCSAVLVPISVPPRYLICDDLSCKNLDVKVKKIRTTASFHTKDPTSFAFSAQDNGGCLGKRTRQGQADSNTPREYFLNTQKSVPQSLCDPELSIYLTIRGMVLLLEFANPFLNHVKP